MKQELDRLVAEAQTIWDALLGLQDQAAKVHLKIAEVGNLIRTQQAAALGVDNQDRWFKLIESKESTAMDLTAAARPVRLTGSSELGILIIHGFTSTPGSVAEWAGGLHKSTGATVLVPLLPGHGTRWQDLNKVSWQDWEKTVLDAFDELAKTCRKVAVGGLSLGGALSALVALRRPQAVALILVNHLAWMDNPLLPLAPVLKHLIASTPAIAGDIKKPGVKEPAYDMVPTFSADETRKVMLFVRKRLGEITMPVMIFKSREDHVIPQFSATKTFDRLGTEWIEMVWLEDSYHVATMDNDLPVIVDRSAAFLTDVISR